MAIKKSDLYSSLWASCDELRGGMDASQYKGSVQPAQWPHGLAPVQRQYAVLCEPVEDNRDVHRDSPRAKPSNAP